MSAWPEYSCCLLLDIPLLADLTEGRPSYLCNSSCLSNIFEFSPSLKPLVICYAACVHVACQLCSCTGVTCA